MTASTERDDPILLTLGGVTHDTWMDYRIDSDLLTPADAWEMSIGSPGLQPLPDSVQRGAPMSLTIGRDLVMTGNLDTIEDRCGKHGRTLRFNGRDLGGRLMDNSAAQLTLNMARLSQIIEQAVKPLGISKIDWRAGSAADLRQRVHTEPGQCVWDWLKAACEANQVWPWFEPDGTLVIGEPDYSQPPVAALFLDGEKTNVLHLDRVDSMHDVFEEVVVYGQAAGQGEEGVAQVKGRAHWPQGAVRGYVRRHVVVDGNCATTALANARAQKFNGDARMRALKITASVEGHRLGDLAVKEADRARLWTPGMRVEIRSPAQRIQGVFFVMQRVLKLNRSEGKTTELHFVEDGSWLLDVAKVKAKRRNDFHKKRLNYVQ